ncbi:CsbD family protein [Catellatospora tritici]|uniref:CsbD family protein n=1 Tax=Catellatospora tritici TaxID=2851566 RepID=UPI001C2D99E0|nr:CsbD family protein [Catellatospora tritici]MBV1855545.1 CsbD family protein [Catellatospora tritici]
MGALDEAKHEGQELLGKAKEKIGDATDNHSLQAEGIADQAKAKINQAGDDIRDAIRGRDEDEDEVATRSQR